MLYRSPYTRWALSAIGVVAGAVFTFGDEAKWRSTPSFRWLGNFPAPLQVWGVALILYSLLLLPWRTRPVAYAMGAFLYGVFAISLLATLGDGGPKNIVTIAALLDVIVFHAYSIRTAEALKQTTVPRVKP